ncbi:MAG: lamin tail domain-containing protein, partial [Lewinella sp.]|nr:lamin tail domain-containing protein [Lewinella sp.]
MRFFTLSLLLLISAWAVAQTNHQVTASGLTFSPADLVIEAGDTVTWTNAGGFHNVNGSQATYPDNPEGFSSGAASSDAWTFQHVFTLPGTYGYQCDIHVGANMVGSVTVNDATGGDVNIVITEIMYNPPEPDEVYEFIELYNNGENAVNLLNYAITAGIDFTFTSGYSLGAGEYVIIASDSVAFEAAFGVPAFQWTSGGLSN